MEYVIRRERALAEATALGLEALLVTKMTHIRYLTGFTGSAGVLVLTPRPLLVVDLRYSEQARAQTDGIAVEGDCAPPQLWPTAVAMLNRRKHPRLGVDTRNLTAEQYLSLVSALGQDTLTDTAGLVERLRAIKDADEIAALTDAANLAEELVARIPTWMRPGRVENEIAGEIEYAQRHLGAERSAAPILVSSGERSTLPHGAASERVIQGGDPVIVDLSPVVRGYRADLARTYYLGTAPEDFRRLHRAITEAQTEAIQAVRAGVRACDVDAVARRSLARHQLDGFFKHSLGHSMGLDQHEPPLLSPYDQTVLQAGMIVMIEPGVYVPGVGGARIEDAMLVTEEGCVPLRPSDTSLREL